MSVDIPDQIPTSSSMQNKDNSSNLQNLSTAVTPTHVEADVLVSTGSDGKTSIFLLVWVAFYHSVQAGQDRAQLQQQELYQLSSIQSGLVDQISSINFQVLSDAEAKKKSPNMGIITQINVNNQRIQARINIMQDQTGQLQQLSQVASSQAATQVQTVTQSVNQSFSVAQMTVDITKAVMG